MPSCWGSNEALDVHYKAIMLVGTISQGETAHVRLITGTNTPNLEPVCRL